MYDVIIIGAGASGMFLAYELRNSGTKVLLIDSGRNIEERHCPITMGKVDKCINCPSCAIMTGFGGAGTLSDGKYNLTTEFGGDLHQIVGYEKAMELMLYVDDVLDDLDGRTSKLYSTEDTDLRTLCLRNDLHLLSAKVRHFGTDRNVEILKKIYAEMKDKIEMRFLTTATGVEKKGTHFEVVLANGETVTGEKVVLASGRSGSKWMHKTLNHLGLDLSSNRVDIGLRIEVPAEVMKHITDEVYESKIVYKTVKYNDMVRTFCMNPYGQVVAENTNGIITVNGHAYADSAKHSENTNFALLVTNHFTEPFKDSNEYGESIARLSNMLGGGVLLQRFGDLVKGRRSSARRMEKCFTHPTLKATAGDLSLVMPKRQLDDIIEMIYQLDRIAPGMANEDTLLYGVEVKFYNSRVEVTSEFETKIPGLYAIGDGAGITHSLSQASASGVGLARIFMA